MKPHLRRLYSIKTSSGNFSPDDITSLLRLTWATVAHVLSEENMNHIKLARNNDLIFGDADGVVCIPAEKWNFILNHVKKALKKEMLVKLEATFGEDPFEVLNKIGTF